MNKKLSDLLFREASIEDLPSLRELEQGVIDAERPFNKQIKKEPTYYYDIEDLLSSDAVHLLVVEVNGRIIATGYAQIRESTPCFTHKKHAYLGFMYVLPDFRGQGVNSKIIEKLLMWSKQQDVEDCYLDVYAENTSAIKAYEKVGFTSSLIEMKLAL